MRAFCRSGRWWAATVGAFLLVVAPPARGQGYEEVLVSLRPGELSLPSGAASASLTATSVASADLRALFDSCGAIRVALAYPSWHRGDTLRVDRHGHPHRVRDRGDTYRIGFPDAGNLGQFLFHARMHPGVLIAEPLPRPKFCASYPNDSLFSMGRQWGLYNFGQSDGSQSGTPGKDIDAPGAWSLGKGNSNIWIGIIDNGVTALHPDLQNRFSPYSSPNYDDVGPNAGHGFLVAGVAAANANNLRGMAGVDWNASIDSKYIGQSLGKDPSYIGDAIQAAIGDHVDVMNHSYNVQDLNGNVVDNATVAMDLAESYMLDIVNVAAMGNDGAGTAQYPAAYPFQMLAVGAVDNTGTVWNQSNYGNWIDVVAPGVHIWSTYPDSTYRQVDGTSLAAPAVSGLASLMLAKRPQLDNDDIEGLIKAAATPRPPGGDSTRYGAGRINARRAMEYLGAPHVLKRGTSRVRVHADSQWVYINPYGISGLTDGTSYGAFRWTIEDTVSFSSDTTGGNFRAPPTVWGRGYSWDDTVGYRPDTSPYRTYGVGFCEPVPGSITSTGCRMRTYAFHVQKQDYLGNWIYVWVPTDPSRIVTQWSAFEARPGAAPDSTNSFYVPQAGSVGSPVEGHDAFKLFRACPNNDGGSSLPNNVRIKVVVRDANGLAIPGVSAADIYILFNGGTAIQGFSGIGADSIIANSRWNQNPLCPDVRTIEADTTTDANGVTYITFTGKTPGSPGVGTRDPARKWGHYDSEIPVYALGTKLRGHITSNNDSLYVLQIKNLDFEGGLGQGVGEMVDFNDFASEAAHQGEADSADPKNWWRDFDSSGAVDFNDLSIMVHHGSPTSHTCTYPNNP